MKKALLIAAAVIVLTPAALALLGVVLGHEKITTHPVAGTVREIVVNSDSGDVRFIRTGTRVQVRETQHYVLRKPTLEQDLTDGVLTLETDCDTFFFNCSTDLRVTVPAGVRINVQADSGDVHIQARGRPRRLVADTDSGDVHVRAPTGDYAVDTETDSGDIEIDRAIIRDDRAPRSIQAHTDSGDVTLDAG